MRSRRHHPGLPDTEATGGGERPASGLSRRDFLLRSTTVVASGMLATRLGSVRPAHAHHPGPEHEPGHDHGDHPEPALPIWAATRARDGRYFALTGDAAEPGVAELAVDGQGSVRLGAPAGLAFPDDFVPAALLATGGRLLAAGASVRETGSRTVHYGPQQLLPGDRGGVPTDEGYLEGSVRVPTHAVRPAVVELTPQGPRTLGLEAQAPDGFGIATGIVELPGGRLGVLVEGAAEPEQSYNDVTRFAESDGSAAAWTFAVLASRLGEGHKSHAAVTTGRAIAATVDQDGTRAFHERGLAPGARWTPLGAGTGEGPLLAVVPQQGDTVEVVEASGSEVVRLRHRHGGPGWQHAGTVAIPGDDVLAVVAVAGTLGEVVAMGEADAVLSR